MRSILATAAFWLCVVSVRAQTNFTPLIQIAPNTNHLAGAWYFPNGFRYGNWASSYADKQVTLSWNSPTGAVVQVMHRAGLTSSYGAWEGVSPLLTNANSFTFGELPLPNMFYQVVQR